MGAQEPEAARKLFARDCRFIAGATSDSALPGPALPEVAFAGRSNVGKSSLLNALTGRNALARTSHTPGRTRQINFFALDERLMLVDLPGYGYARAPKGEIRAWTALVRRYLAGRPTLRRVCLLIDARHGHRDADHDVMDLLDAAAVTHQSVLTKLDKLRGDDVVAALAAASAACARHTAAHPVPLATSARTGAGIEALREALAAFAAPVLAGPDQLG